MKQSIRINSVAAAVAAAFGAVAAPAFAQLPSGPAVVNGSAGIASDGSRMTITNSANAVLNWQSFSIGAPNSVRFEQPSASSQVLNRVVGNDPSNILGSLSSNGGVWLINPHGVLFGNSARIDVAGLVASSLGISNDDFLAGRVRFDAAGLPSGQVLNRGELQTSFGGHVWLVGGSVSNEGLIRSPGGNIVLAAGKSIELVDSGAPNVAVRVAAPDNAALNLGRLLAPGGGSIDIHGGIVNQQGIVRADSVGLDAAGRVTIKARGEIQLGAGSVTSASSAGSGAGGKVLVESADGDTLVQGQVGATSAAGVGGQLHLLGRNVGVYGQALVDASGAAGGGEVLAGGDYQGANPSVKNAAATYLGPNATVRADATGAGSGGKIVFWGDESTRIYGSIGAKGGPLGGDGGFVETSAHVLDARPKHIDVAAANGKAGTWLLDPGNVEINGDSTLEGGMSNDDVPGFSRISNRDDAIIAASTIVSALENGSNVTIRTGGGSGTTQLGDIVVSSSIILPANAESSGSLTLEAHNDIVMRSGVEIRSDNKPLPVDFLADRDHNGVGSIRLEYGANIETRGGDITMTVPALAQRAGSSITLEGNNQLNAGTGQASFTTSNLNLWNTSQVTAKHILVDAGYVSIDASGLKAQGTDESSITINTNNLWMNNGALEASVSDASSLDGARINTLAGYGYIDLHTSTMLAQQVYVDTYGLTLDQSTLTASGTGTPLWIDAGSFSNTAGGLSAPQGRWIVSMKSGTPFRSADFSGLDYQFVQVDANDVAPALSGAGQNGILVYDPLDVQIKLNATRDYDGTTHASFTNWLSHNASSSFQLQDNTGGSTLQANFQDKNAGTDKPIVYSAETLPFLVVTDSGKPVYGSTQSYIGDILPLAVSASGLVAANKVYDATRTATLSGMLSGAIGNDDVTVTGISGLFDTKDAGTGKTVTISGGTLSGADAGNYLFTGGGTTTADITPRPISAAGLHANDKVYDGTTIATLSGGLSDVLPGDVLTIDTGSAHFDNKNVGSEKVVTITGGLLGGADAANYTLGGPLTTTASITPKPVTIALTGQVAKVYDATTGATLGANNFSLQGLVAGDAVSVGGPVQGSYDTRNAGQEKLVSAAGSFTVAGADAMNYSIGSTVLTAATNIVNASASGYIGTITPKAISATGLSAESKVYDGTRSATVSGTPSGVIGGDNVSVAGISGLFDTKDAGTGKTVTIAGGTLSGADAGNYSFSGGATTTANITPRPITAAGIRAGDKVYDGTTAATLSGGFTGALPGDSLTVGTTAGVFDTRNAGDGKTVTFTSSVLAGADAANYMLTGPLTTTASIAPKPVTISITGEVRKEYDATANASLGADQFALNGLIANDAVSVRGPAQGSYDSPNVGQQRQVNATGAFEIAGADAPNYRVGEVRLGGASNTVNASASGEVGVITPATLTYTAAPSTGEPGLPVTGLDGTVTGFKGTDTLATATSGTLVWQSATTLQSLPGAYAIEGAGLTAANYRFVQAPGNATALAMKFNLTPARPQLQAQESSVQAIGTALRTAILAVDPRGSGGGVFDRSGPAAARAFSALRIGAMNQDELAQMLALRKEFKRKLFADAVYKLEIDPSLADVQPCASAGDAASGACRLTPAQVELIHATKRPVQAATKSASGRVAALPQIERKMVVLFGINDYQDKTIPQLENAVPDVDAVSRIFAEKLGYEVRVVRNPDKAEIIRTLNGLAAEMNSADSVVIYYAGHGYSLEKNGAGYWIPSDAKASDPRGWISNSDVAKALASISAKQMALISDSCYSGAFARDGIDAVGHDVTVADVLAKRSVVVLSSGGDEPVADEGKEGHSIFAWNLMQAVGSVTGWKPGSTIFTNVQAAVKKEFPQTPKYGSVTAAGHQAGGEYLFELR
ncbi:Heme/hemopexin-binding protein [Massilia sp. Bi118]|uniref:YDG domain-containing protein n=1 Tax=Massilia sp. Bi118 TaxID=2822346 RepID=UPI001DB25929|nr:YDG domain-containing protein [Massilia sp. Bi118]CAH0296654.1 Heme/hemopexin-binding protein [Massilia sp. Bi118]